MAGAMIDHARGDKQQIREAIHIRQQMRIHMLTSENDEGAFSSAADCAGKVQQGARPAATRKNETPKRWKLGLESIDPFFESSDVRLSDGDLGHTVGNSLGRVGQARADRKQILLKTFQQLDDVAGQFSLRSDRTKTRVQLVDVAVGGHARVGFRHAGAAEKRRVAAVAGTRINLHGRQYT